MGQEALYSRCQGLHPQGGARKPWQNFYVYNRFLIKAHTCLQTFFVLTPQFRRGGGPMFGKGEALSDAE